MSTALVRWVEDQVGPLALISSRTKAGSTVVEVRVHSGQRFFGKQAQLGRHWSAEVRAYRRWTPGLRDLTPSLRAAEEPQRLLLVSAVAGKHPAVYDAAAHCAAGRSLRALHESRPNMPAGPALLGGMPQRLERLLTRTPGLFTEQQMAFARDQVRKITLLPARARVPCHGDYRPHNWLMDEAGTVRIIDFGEARWHVPVFDLTHLYLGCWWADPDLATAFFDGYGRQLDEAEQEFIRLHLVVNALRTTWFGHRHARPAREAFGRRRLDQLMAGQLSREIEPQQTRTIRSLGRLLPTRARAVARGPFRLPGGVAKLAGADEPV